MMEQKEINTDTLREWLSSGRRVNVLDIRPAHEREEWHIPGSTHADAYDELKKNNPDALHSIDLDKSAPVVTVCAGGKTSMIAAGLLQKAGYDVYNLQGGMKGWSLAWNRASVAYDNFEVVQFRRTGKGCLSYMIISGQEAMVVDASLPVAVYCSVIDGQKLSLKHVADTHIHADHLSRSKQLAESYAIQPSMPPNDKLKYRFTSVPDGQRFTLGKIQVKAIHTPGHTLESTCYLIGDTVLLTGDTLFTKGVGRPDLKSSREEAVNKSFQLFHSLQKIIGLDQSIILMPGHTSQPVAFDRQPIQSTLKDVVENTPLLGQSESEFVQSLLKRIPSPPENYLVIVDRNISGEFKDVNLLDLEAGANRCAIQ